MPLLSQPPRPHRSTHFIDRVTLGWGVAFGLMFVLAGEATGQTLDGATLDGATLDGAGAEQTKESPKGPDVDRPVTAPTSQPSPSATREASTQASNESSLKASEDEIRGWIESLGSGDFALRERSATRLTELGGPILPRLRAVAKESDDPEVRLRAGQIVMRLSRDDLKLRIEAFLAGKNVHFEGWRYARQVLGESLVARELFVEMLKSYPELCDSLERAPRDKAMALKKVVDAVENRMFAQRKSPTRSDLFALLFPSLDPNVPLDGGHEDVLIAALYKHVASQLLDDAHLARPFTVLLRIWFPRSSLKNRNEVLFLAMNLGIPQVCPLARQTLAEDADAETLVLAFQAIARFGTENDSAAIAKFLDDRRPAGERGLVNGNRLRTVIGDVAMAAIARLHDVPLTEVGFAQDSVHEKFAFVLNEIGFPPGNEDARKSTREKIDRLLAPIVTPERS